MRDPIPFVLVLRSKDPAVWQVVYLYPLVPVNPSYKNVIKCAFEREQTVRK
jgi:hypothetical protein